MARIILRPPHFPRVIWLDRSWNRPSASGARRPSRCERRLLVRRLCATLSLCSRSPRFVRRNPVPPTGKFPANPSPIIGPAHSAIRKQRLVFIHFFVRSPTSAYDIWYLLTMTFCPITRRLRLPNFRGWVKETASFTCFGLASKGRCGVLAITGQDGQH